MDTGAQYKAADCLSRLVKLPQDRQATVWILTTTDYVGPAFNTRSRTAEFNIKENLTPQAHAGTVTPDITTVKNTPDAIPKPLTEDRLHTLLQMQRTDPFCKHISKCLSNGKVPKHEADLFSRLKGYYINILQIQTRNSWPLSIQKLGITSAHGSTWQTWSSRSYLHILPHKTPILLGRHEQGHEEIHQLTVHYAAQGKIQGSALPFTNNRDTGATIWQNSHRLGNRMQNLHFRQQAYSHHHWSSHRMARSFPHTRQVSRHYSVYIH